MAKKRIFHLVLLYVVMFHTYFFLLASPANHIDTEKDILGHFLSSSRTTRKNEIAAASRFQACSSATQYFYQPDLDVSIKRAVDYHFRGENLRSVSKFKDSAQDATLKKLGLEFIPNDAQEQPPSDFTNYLKEYYNAHFDPRNGYGKPLPGHFNKDKHPALFEKRWFDVMEDTSSRFKWDAALGPIGPNCTNLIEVGPPNDVDGSKFFCIGNGDEATSPKKKKEECHIISIGGNDNWKFEEGVREQLGCVTHTFDCTLKGGKPRRKPKDDNVRFYNSCIDSVACKDKHGRQYQTYTDILNSTGIAQSPTLFKMDVEGYEFEIFVQMVQDTDPQLLPQQVAVELHWASRMTGLTWMPRIRSSAEIALLMNMLMTAGYLPIHLTFNPYCVSCMEVLFFRVLC